MFRRLHRKVSNVAPVFAAVGRRGGGVAGGVRGRVPATSPGSSGRSVLRRMVSESYRPGGSHRSLCRGDSLRDRRTAVRRRSQSAFLDGGLGPEQTFSGRYGSLEHERDTGGRSLYLGLRGGPRRISHGRPFGGNPGNRRTDPGSGLASRAPPAGFRPGRLAGLFRGLRIHGRGIPRDGPVLLCSTARAVAALRRCPGARQQCHQ